MLTKFLVFSRKHFLGDNHRGHWHFTMQSSVKVGEFGYVAGRTRLEVEY